MPDNTFLIKLLAPEEQQAWAEIQYKVLSRPYELINYLDTLINSANFKTHKKFFSGKILHDEHPLFCFFGSTYACDFFESEFTGNPISSALLGEIFNRILLLSADFRDAYAAHEEIDDFYCLLAKWIGSSRMKDVIKHAKIPKNFFCGSEENKFLLIRNISNFAPHLWPVFIDNSYFFQRFFHNENGSYDIAALLEILTSQLTLENINTILLHIFKKDASLAKAFSKHTIEFLPEIKIPLITILQQSNEYRAQPFYKRHLLVNEVEESPKHAFITSKIRQIYAALEFAHPAKITDGRDEQGISLAFFMGEYCGSLGLFTPKHREKAIIEYRKFLAYYHNNPTQEVSFDIQNLLSNIVLHILLPKEVTTKNPALHEPILKEIFGELLSLNFRVKDPAELSETELQTHTTLSEIRTLYTNNLIMSAAQKLPEKEEEFPSDYPPSSEENMNERESSLDSLHTSVDDNSFDAEQNDDNGTISEEDFSDDQSSIQEEDAPEEYGFDLYPNVLKVRVELHEISTAINKNFGAALLSTVSGQSESAAVDYWNQFSIPSTRKLLSIAKELDPDDILSVALSKFAYELLGTITTINAFILYPEFIYSHKNGFVKIASWDNKENKHAFFSLAANYFEKSREGLTSHPETAYNYCLCLYYLMHYSPDKDKPQAREKLFTKYEIAAKEFPELFQESFLLQEFKNHKAKEKNRKKKKAQQLKRNQPQQANVEQVDTLPQTLENDTDSSTSSPGLGYICDAAASSSSSSPSLQLDDNQNLDEENTITLIEQNISSSGSGPSSSASATESDNSNPSDSEEEISVEVIHVQEQLLSNNAQKNESAHNAYTKKKLTFQFQLSVNKVNVKTAEQFALDKKQQTIQVFQQALEKASLPYSIFSELARQFSTLTPNNLIQMAFERHTFNQPSYTIWVGEQDPTDPYYKLYTEQQEPIIVRKPYQQGLTWNKTQGYKLRLYGDPREHGLDLSVSVIDKKGTKHCYLVVLFGLSDDMCMKHNEYNRKNARSKYQKMSITFETIDQAEIVPKKVLGM